MQQYKVTVQQYSHMARQVQARPTQCQVNNNNT
jgi:hypothetical protein